MAGFITDTRPITPTLTIMMNMICSISVMPRCRAGLMDITRFRLDSDRQPSGKA